MVKLVLYGGSFDPPHLAHFILASTAIEATGAGRLVFVPAAQSPLKGNAPAASGAVRVRMLTAASRDQEAFSVSAFEVDRGGTSYTWETVVHFMALHGLAVGELGLLIGQDQLADLRSWVKFDVLNENVTWLLCHRHGEQASTPAASEFLQRVLWLPSPRIEISSSKIRELIAAGSIFRYYVPQQVYEIIAEEELYST